MATPITHIVLADRIFSTHFKNQNRDQFLIGVSFPDIRYLGVIDRSKTHPDFSLEELKAKDSFAAGVGIHALTDVVRERFVTDRGIYEIAPASKHVIHAIKFLEDRLFYKNVTDWDKIARAFDEILGEELSYGIKREDILRWHGLIQRYFLLGPTARGVRGIALGLGLREEDFTEMENLVERLERDEKVLTILRDFYHSFESLIK